MMKVYSKIICVIFATIISSIIILYPSKVPSKQDYLVPKLLPNCLSVAKHPFFNGVYLWNSERRYFAHESAPYMLQLVKDTWAFTLQHRRQSISGGKCLLENISSPLDCERNWGSSLTIRDCKYENLMESKENDIKSMTKLCGDPKSLSSGNFTILHENAIFPKRIFNASDSISLLIDGHNAFSTMKRVILEAEEFLYMSFWRLGKGSLLCDSPDEDTGCESIVEVLTKSKAKIKRIFVFHNRYVSAESNMNKEKYCKDEFALIALL